jgi:hypothetical protein
MDLVVNHKHMFHTLLMCKLKCFSTSHRPHSSPRLQTSHRPQNSSTVMLMIYLLLIMMEQRRVNKNKFDSF